MEEANADQNNINSSIKVETLANPGRKKHQVQQVRIGSATTINIKRKGKQENKPIASHPLQQKSSIKEETQNVQKSSMPSSSNSKRDRITERKNTINEEPNTNKELPKPKSWKPKPSKQPFASNNTHSERSSNSSIRLSARRNNLAGTKQVQHNNGGQYSSNRGSTNNCRQSSPPRRYGRQKKFDNIRLGHARESAPINELAIIRRPRPLRNAKVFDRLEVTVCSSQNGIPRSDPRKRTDSRSNCDNSTHLQRLDNTIVGVVMTSPADKCRPESVDFLIYDFKSRKFVQKVEVVCETFPSCCLGSWMRLFFPNQRINVNELRCNSQSTPLNPNKVLVCQRRINTRVIGNTVNFLVQATLRKPHNGCENDGHHYYHCRLGTLKLTKSQLMGEETIENNEDLPERLKLWCFPIGQDGEGNFGLPSQFEVERIDERIWIQIRDDASIESEKDDEDEENGEENKKTLAVQHYLKRLRLQPPPEKCPHSSGFSNWLSNLIEAHFEEKRMNPKKRAKIEEFIQRLEGNLREELDMPLLKLALFGSIKSGFGSNDCDLDLCMINTGWKLTNLDEDNEKRKKMLRKLVDFLRHNNKETFIDVISILDARTPIVKFKHKKTGFIGDISIENKLALNNTELLKLYIDFDPRVAPLGFAIKRWAKVCGINDASIGSISSYAYIIMLIHFLQRCEPPVLPFLQNEKIGEQVEGWNVSFEKDTQKLKLPNENTQSIAELFRDFLYYYAFEFNSITDVAQIRTPHPYNKETRDDRRLRLCVEDPFDLSHNLTSGVRQDTLNYVVECFRSLLRGLERFDKEHFSPEIQDKILPEVDFERFLLPYKPRRIIYIKKKAPKKEKAENPIQEEVLDKNRQNDENGEVRGKSGIVKPKKKSKRKPGKMWRNGTRKERAERREKTSEGQSSSESTG